MSPALFDFIALRPHTVHEKEETFLQMSPVPFSYALYKYHLLSHINCLLPIAYVHEVETSALSPTRKASRNHHHDFFLSIQLHLRAHDRKLHPPRRRSHDSHRLATHYVVLLHPRQCLWPGHRERTSQARAPGRQNHSHGPCPAMIEEAQRRIKAEGWTNM